ncbi:MAG: V-type ATP synthase subunit D [Gemmatimonadetes bacterium]|nr:V-type ATP synthase subunit D [Gemmatimonadota bacterium]
MPRLGEAAPTRSNLLRARRRLAQVRKGVALLHRKREAVVAELFHLARPAVDARVAIAERAAEAYPALLEALALHGESGLRALAWPPRDLPLEVRASQVWGTPVAEIVARPPIPRSLETRGTPPGAAGPAAVAAADRFERLAELLLDAAPREALLRRLGEALAQTSRQLHGLERRLAPELARRVTAVRRTLDEREREEQLRLKRLLAARRRAGPVGDGGVERVPRSG